MTPFDEAARPPDGVPPDPAPWDRVTIAVALFLIDPTALGGLWLRARTGPVRDRVMAALAPLGPRRFHPGADDDALFGGLDLGATLSAGKAVRHAGLLDRGDVLHLAMAERTPPGLAARLAQRLDSTRPDGPAFCLIAVDEGADPDEALPPALADRLGLFLALDDLSWHDTAPIALPGDKVAMSRTRLARLPRDEATLARLVQTAAALGIDSARAVLQALACARAAAAWRGNAAVTEVDLTTAVELVLAHRATALPQEDPRDPPQESSRTQPDDERDELADPPDLPPEDSLVDAARAALPAELIARLEAARAARTLRAHGAGAGAAHRSFRRGRPLPARPGRPGQGRRIDVIATLRAAAPLQGLRKDFPRPGTLAILPADLRIRRFEECSDRVLIFAVDASGSQAVARLAEVKGAVELLLSEAYRKRDHVALVSFRGPSAELSLPPTRSLVRAKKSLAGLPGGGGTPLAAGLRAAMNAATQARARGMTPIIALLTDGRANVALDGSPERRQATEDATRVARAIGTSGTKAVVIDTGRRRHPSLAALAEAMGAEALVLPQARAVQLSAALGAVLDR